MKSEGFLRAHSLNVRRYVQIIYESMNRVQKRETQSQLWQSLAIHHSQLGKEKAIVTVPLILAGGSVIRLSGDDFSTWG